MDHGFLKEFPIGKRWVGTDHPVYVIAEIGSNHDGKLEQALQLIEQAHEAGADAVKFQSFTADGLAAKAYPELYAAFSEPGLALDPRWWPPLANAAKNKGMDLLSTPFDLDWADKLEGLGVPAFKIASGDLTHTALLRRVAKTGRPIVLSTGMATMGEVETALGTIAQAGGEQVALLHCVSLYPSRYEDMNIRAMVTMRESFGTPVGFSDHANGWSVDAAAVTLGACVIEKHFTLSRKLKGPDHPHSLEPAEFKSMVQDLRNIEAAMGTGVKGPVPEEMEERKWARRGLYAKKAIPAGTALTEDMLDIVRPCFHLGPLDLPLVLGRPARKAIAAGEAIMWEML